MRHGTMPLRSEIANPTNDACSVSPFDARYANGWNDGDRNGNGCRGIFRFGGADDSVGSSTFRGRRRRRTFSSPSRVFPTMVTDRMRERNSGRAILPFARGNATEARSSASARFGTFTDASLLPSLRADGRSERGTEEGLIPMLRIHAARFRRRHIPREIPKDVETKSLSARKEFVRGSRVSETVNPLGKPDHR